MTALVVHFSGADSRLNDKEKSYIEKYYKANIQSWVEIHHGQRKVASVQELAREDLKARFTTMVAMACDHFIKEKTGLHESYIGLDECIQNQNQVGSDFDQVFKRLKQKTMARLESHPSVEKFSRSHSPKAKNP
jgi:hypothetical protein